MGENKYTLTDEQAFHCRWQPFLVVANMARVIFMIFFINRFHMIRSYMKAPFGTNVGFWNLWILGEF